MSDMTNRKFTIHFATINTAEANKTSIKKLIFTIHFATINTLLNADLVILDDLFTIHFATINTFSSYNS